MAESKPTSAGSVVLMLLAAGAAVGAVYLVVRDFKEIDSDPPKSRGSRRNPTIKGLS